MNGLIASYELEANGDDSHDDALNGVQQGNVSFEAGTPGNCLVLVGDGNYLLPTAGGYFDTDYISLEAWIYLTTPIFWERVVAKATYNLGSYEDQHVWGISLNPAGYYTFTAVDDANHYKELSDTIAAPAGWCQIVSTYDGTTMRIYHDSVQKATATDLSGVLTKQPNLPAFIGARCDNSGPPGYSTNPYGPERFRGKIGAVRFWNRHLIQSEIDYLYNGGSGRAY